MKKIAVFAAALACACTAPARADDQSGGAFVQALTEDNIRAFVEEQRTVTASNSFDRSPEEIEDYLKHHLTEKGSFRSRITYQMPGYPVQTVDMDYRRDEFIETVVNAENLFTDYATEVELSNIKIAGNKHGATLHAVITETGKMPWPDGKGNQELVPVKGVSECDQKLMISLSNYIQLADVACTTVVSFTAFGKPLGE